MKEKKDEEYLFPVARHLITKYYQPLLMWLCSGLLVVFSAKIGAAFVRMGWSRGHDLGYNSWFSSWDGQWYNLISNYGYNYSDFGAFGPQVFFPLYPLVGRLFNEILNIGSEYSLALVSWLCSAVFCCLWLHYCELHPHKADKKITLFSLSLILFWPTAYFLRIDYTESLFLMLIAIFFIGMMKKWNAYWLILVCGLITGIRPTGIVCSAVLALHFLLRNHEMRFIKRFFIALAVGIVSAWGLYFYMFTLNSIFGDPLIFIEKQQAWNRGNPPDAFFFKFWEYISLKPAWGFMVNGEMNTYANYPFNIQNRALFLVTLVFLMIGKIRRWLTAEEFAYCLLSLLFFYFFIAPRNMEAMGRYTYSLIPIFLVMGRCFRNAPASVKLCVIAFLSPLLFLHTALFIMNHALW